jgi:hypothetical protein
MNSSQYTETLSTSRQDTNFSLMAVIRKAQEAFPTKTEAFITRASTKGSNLQITFNLRSSWTGLKRVIAETGQSDTIDTYGKQFRDSLATDQEILTALSRFPQGGEWVMEFEVEDGKGVVRVGQRPAQLG